MHTSTASCDFRDVVRHTRKMFWVPGLQVWTSDLALCGPAGCSVHKSQPLQIHKHTRRCPENYMCTSVERRDGTRRVGNCNSSIRMSIHCVGLGVYSKSLHYVLDRLHRVLGLLLCLLSHTRMLTRPLHMPMLTTFPYTGNDVAEHVQYMLTILVDVDHAARRPHEPR